MTVVDDLRKRLADGDVIIIDGGMGTELEARGVPTNRPGWAGSAVLEYEDDVIAAHEEFIRAGAEVIITNTFASNRLWLEPLGLGDRVDEVNRRSVTAALRARDNAAQGPVIVAGAMHAPPGGVGRTTGGTSIDSATVLECFREQVAIQAEAGVDLFVPEMISPDYGPAMVQAAAESGLPVWLGVTDLPYAIPENGQLTPREVGDLVDELVQIGGDRVMAVTPMHIDVSDIDAVLDDVKRRWDGPLGAYPHHGHPSATELGHWEFSGMAPDAFAAAAQRWVAAGAQIVGGCCGIRPAHIRALKEQLPERIPAGSRA